MRYLKYGAIGLLFTTGSAYAASPTTIGAAVHAACCAVGVCCGLPCCG